MKNTLYLLCLLFVTAAHADNIDVAKIKQLHKKFQHSLPCKIMDGALSYGIVGYGLKSVGAVLHTLSGNPHQYEYITQNFGQIHNLEYPTEHKPSLSLQQIWSSAAQKLLTAGSVVHWPLRSAWDFLNGVVVQTKYISNIKHSLQNNDGYPYENPTELLKSMKSIRKNATIKTSIGMAVGCGPIIAYDAYKNYVQPYL